MTLNYPFVYRIFIWCAKGIVIILHAIHIIPYLTSLFKGCIGEGNNINVKIVLTKCIVQRRSAFIKARKKYVTSSKR